MKTYIRAALLLLCLFCCLCADSQDSAPQQLRPMEGNPFGVIYDFVNAFYPNLGNAGGEIAIRADYGPAGVGVSSLRAEVTVCRVSGVPGSAYRAVAPPACGGAVEPDLTMAVFLDMRLDHPAFDSVYAKEKSLLTKERSLKESVSKNGAEARMESLKALHPKYGPDNRRGFISTMPVANVRKFTGCVLDVDSTYFDSESQDFKWVVKGVHEGSEAGCRAEFEPFEGRLVAAT